MLKGRLILVFHWTELEVRTDIRHSQIKNDARNGVEAAPSCLGAGSCLCECLVADSSCVAAGGAEPVFESLAWECERGTVGTMAYVLYWGKGRL